MAKTIFSFRYYLCCGDFFEVVGDEIENRTNRRLRSIQNLIQDDYALNLGHFSL